MRAIFRAAALLVSLGAVFPVAAHAQANPDWHRPNVFVDPEGYKTYVRDARQPGHGVRVHQRQRR
jgi:hypothetical protein